MHSAPLSTIMAPLTPRQKILIDTGPSERGSHRIETVMQCGQKYAYKYRLGLQENSDPLTKGTLGHIGTAHYYMRLLCVQRGFDKDVYYEPQEAIDIKAHMMGAIAAPHRAKMKEVVERYMMDKLMETPTILGVEYAAEMMLGGHRVTQRFDMVMRDTRGRFWIYDHKFVSRVDNKTKQRYTLAGQFLLMEHFGHYFARYMPQLFGSEFGGIRINLIGIEDGKIERVTPDPRPHALAKFPLTVAEAERRIALIDAMDPWQVPQADSETVCITSYGRCPFFDLCREGAPVTATSAASPPMITPTADAGWAIPMKF